MVRHAVSLIRPNTNTTTSWVRLLIKSTTSTASAHRLTASRGIITRFEESYNLTASSWREADDVNRRRNANLFYEWTPDSNWLSSLKADFDYQKTKVAAVNNKGSFPMDYSTWTRNYKSEGFGRNIQPQHGHPIQTFYFAYGQPTVATGRPTSLVV